MRVRGVAFAVLFGLVGGSASGATLGISELDTKDLELLYIDPLQTYMTPYIARSYENSLAFQEKTFNWKPWDRPTVFLVDVSDVGNASARAVPTNDVIVKI